MATRKHSRQRDALLRVISDRTDHPAAEKLYSELREIEPRISLGTVYRNLALLTDEGSILRIVSGDERAHYDYNVTPHDHFWCRTCGEVSDIFPEEAPDPVIKFGGRIESHQTLYTGVCEHCLKKEDQVLTDK